MEQVIAVVSGGLALGLFGCRSAVVGLRVGGAESLTTKGNTITMTAIEMCIGLAVLIMDYTIGPISGSHINPAVSLGVFMNGGLKLNELFSYWVAQIIGGILGAIAIGLISQQWRSFGANQYNEGFLQGAFIGEVIFTFLFVLVVLGSTSKIAPKGFAGIAIGWALAIVNIGMIPIDGASVNPARSIGPALFTGGEALCQIWVYIAAPLIGAFLAAIVWKIFKKEADSPVVE